MIDKIALERKVFDLPITFDDLKYGTKKIIGENLQHVTDKVA
jgi:hypothetical protein